jgi:hypothetical protein
MTHLSSPEAKGKVNINKFRDECRKWVNVSPLPPAQKLVLCKLADYVNSESLVAWPSFDTLAADTGVSRRTVVNAINSARKIGVIKRLYKGALNGRGRSNCYLFPLYDRHSANFAPCQHVSADDTVQTTTPRSANDDATQCKSCTLSSNNHLKDNLRESAASSSSALRAIVVGVASHLTSSDNQISEQADSSVKGLGEGVEIPAAPSDNPRSEPAQRQSVEEVHAEMAARGMDMSASRWGRGRLLRGNK